MSQASFQKMQREKARREKAVAKSERRAERRSAGEEAPAPLAASEQATVLADLAALHERFGAGDIPFDDFVTAKEELTERLNVS